MPPEDADPRPRPRRGRPPSLDRTAALDATRRVIARRGLERARYLDIAEESGVAVSTLQNAFGRLDELLALAIDRSHAIDGAFLATLPDAGAATAWERIETFVNGTLASPLPPDERHDRIPAMESWLVWIELWRLAARDEGAARRTADAYRRWWGAAEAIIADGQRDGSFTTEASAADLAIALNAALDGLAVSLLMRADGQQLAEARRIASITTRRILAA